MFLGTVEFQQGHFDAAEAHYRKALEMNPRSAFAYAHLGEASLFRKDKETALKHLKTALKLDPLGDFGKMARGGALTSDGDSVRRPFLPQFFFRVECETPALLLSVSAVVRIKGSAAGSEEQGEISLGETPQAGFSFVSQHTKAELQDPKKLDLMVRASV